MLTEGNTVTIKVQNPLWHARDRFVPYVINDEFDTFTGTVTYPKWLAHNEIGLTTGNLDFPMRRISKDSIVEVEGVEVDLSSNSKVYYEIKDVGVLGSKGDVYIVT